MLVQPTLNNLATEVVRNTERWNKNNNFLITAQHLSSAAVTNTVWRCLSTMWTTMYITYACRYATCNSLNVKYIY